MPGEPIKIGKHNNTIFPVGAKQIRSELDTNHVIVLSSVPRLGSLCAPKRAETRFAIRLRSSFDGRLQCLRYFGRDVPPAVVLPSKCANPLLQPLRLVRDKLRVAESVRQQRYDLRRRKKMHRKPARI